VDVFALRIADYFIATWSLPFLPGSNALKKETVEVRMKTKQNGAINGYAKALSMGVITSLICLSSVSARPHGNNYSFDRRVESQHQHLDIGLRSGQLTTGEATRIQSHLGTITNTIQTDRAANNGRLTQTERKQMVRAQNVAARNIFQLKHNQNSTVPDRQVDRMNRQQQHVQEGIQSGQLTRGEVARIKANEENIKGSLQKAASNGGLTQAELKKAQQAQKLAARKIFQLKHNNRTQNTGSVSTAPSVSASASAPAVTAAPGVSTAQGNPPPPQD
jgi:hypothetical protein